MFFDSIQQSPQTQIEHHAQMPRDDRAHTSATFVIASQVTEMLGVVDQELLDVLQKYGNNPNRWPALHYAIICDDVRAVEVLLKNGVNPNARTTSTKNEDGKPIRLHVAPLDLAIGYSFDDLKPEMIDLLLNVGADPYDCTCNFSPIAQTIFAYLNAHRANWKQIEARALEVLEVFAFHDVDFNRKCTTDHTPLWMALNYNSPELVKFFLEHGAKLIDV